MKELLQTITSTYNNYRGTGKLLALFLVSVLIIYLLKKKDRPGAAGLFVLSPVSGIGYASSLIFGTLKEKRIRPVYSIIVCCLVVIMLMLSGQFVFSQDDHYTAENVFHVKEDVKRTAEILMRLDGEKRVVAAPQISPYIGTLCYGRVDMLYDHPANGDPDKLEGEARYVYDQLMMSTPDEGRLVRTIRSKGYNYLIYDSSANYFELPLEEYGYELVAREGDIMVYRDRTGESR